MPNVCVIMTATGSSDGADEEVEIDYRRGCLEKEGKLEQL